MKLIETYAKVNNGNPYNDSSSIFVDQSLYIFLLNYLSLKKESGEILLFTDEYTYDNFLNIIPYEEINFKENIHKNNSHLWSTYKLECIKEYNEPFIHIDSDVYLKNFNLIDNFSDDLLIQTTPRFFENTPTFHSKNYDILNEYGLYSDGVLNSGVGGEVFGFNNAELLKIFIDNYDKFMYLYKNCKLHKHAIKEIASISEEYNLALLYEKNYNNTQILADLLSSDIIEYYHFISNRRFKPKNTNYIRNEIIEFYPEQAEIVNKIDKLIYDKYKINNSKKITYNNTQINKNLSNILILSAFTDNISDYGNIGLKNKLEYAEYHNYDIINVESGFNKDRHPAWSKINFIKEYLPEYDYVFWIDADTLIMDFSVKLESFIDGCEDYDFIFTREEWWGHLNSDDFVKFNSGVFFTKNTDFSRKILDDVLLEKYDKPNECGYFWEQSAFWNLYNENKFESFKFYPSKAFNSVYYELELGYDDGDFICHFACDDCLPISRVTLMEHMSLKVKK